MFKRTQKKTQDSPRIIIFSSSQIKAILSESSDSPQDQLTNKQVEALKQYLENFSKELEIRSKYHDELFTSKKREIQLAETKKVVFSLRETDQTSGGALDFLKVKMDILIQEKEDLARFLLRIQHEKKLPMIWVEHDMEMITQIADRIVCLDYGIKIADGVSEEVVAAPEVIEAYLGAKDRILK